MLRSGEYKFIYTSGGRKFYWPVRVIEGDKDLIVKFNYNKSMVDEIKNMEGARWNPENKQWTISNSLRNYFAIRYLCGENVYEPYEKTLTYLQTKRSLFKHQIDLLAHCYTRKHCILASEMGTGKTLVAIELMENTPDYEWWYVGTKSSIYAVQLEMQKWNAQVKPKKYITYESLYRLMQGWPGTEAPRGVIFDESSRLKNRTAKRSQAAWHLAKSIRDDWGEDSYLILMSGSPAPKSPIDWFWQSEVACPGFLKESTEIKLKKRLALIEERENITGGVYPHLVTWFDNSDKCRRCGKMKDDAIHSSVSEVCCTDGHTFIPSFNEVSHLYKRLDGLVMVRLKKDCLDLPPKVYTQVILEQSPSILRAAGLIKNCAKNAIDALVRLRELSDGFQYRETKTGETKPCSVCNGTGQITEIDKSKNVCDHCGGKKIVDIYERTAEYVKCPKEDALIDLLEEHEDIGRLVIYAGFTGSIDRIADICKKQGWEYMRMDGRGISTSTEMSDPLSIFQRMAPGPDKMAFIGHPGSAGMGLTLTASPTIVYWSNDFNAENRIQSEDRIHRPGMCGANIVDLIHLDTDRLVLSNLQKKRDLQSLTLGELK